MNAAALIGYLDCRTVLPPNVPVARNAFLDQLKNSKTIVAWRLTLQARLGYNAMQAGAVVSRQAAFDLLLTASGF